MKRAVIFGAGQMGTMINNLISSEYEVVAFADNRKTGKIGELDILPLKEALAMEPECVIIGVLDEERTQQMISQLNDYSFCGEIITAESLKVFDARSATMRLLAKNDIEGAVAELGVYKGDFAYQIKNAFPGRELHLFDTFRGFSDEDLKSETSNAKSGDFSDTSYEYVKKRIPDAIYHVGYFPDTFDGCEDLKFSFVSLDADLYSPTKAALPLFYERLNAGGSIMVHDYNSTQFPGVKKAVDEYCEEKNISPFPVCDLHGSVVLIKQRG